MPIPSEVETVKRPLLREEIYERLQGWILAGALAPGVQLRDTDLSVRLGVSRTPVREALRMLEDEGLVETASGRWTRVSQLSLREAQELYPAVSVLEQHLVEAVLGQSESHHVATMAATNEALAGALRDGQVGLAAQLDATFHRELWRTAQNGTVAGLLAGLGKKVSRVMNSVKHDGAEARSLLAEHAAMVKALEGGDAGEVRRAISAHWRGSLRRLERQWSERLMREEPNGTRN